MAVPIIIGAIAAGSAIYGAVKGAKGVSDKKEASTIDNKARGMIDSANSRLERQRELTNKELTDYGSSKLKMLNEEIPKFITAYERLKNVDFNNSAELDKLNHGDFSTTVISDLKSGYEMLQASGMGLVAGVGSGAAMAFGAYSGTMMLASASTGTAISALSGAAATNATLAWIGGGSLATGGLGMAGGTMLLGGVVAGPALAILGHFVGNAGEGALNKARGNMEQAETIVAQSKLMVGKLVAIKEVVALASEAFSKVGEKFSECTPKLYDIMIEHGSDYSAFPKACKEEVFRIVKMAQLIKAMLDTPILDENGELVLSTEKAKVIAHVADGNTAKENPDAMLGIVKGDDAELPESMVQEVMFEEKIKELGMVCENLSDISKKVEFQALCKILRESEAWDPLSKIDDFSFEKWVEFLEAIPDIFRQDIRESKASGDFDVKYPLEEVIGCVELFCAISSELAKMQSEVI